MSAYASLPGSFLPPFFAFGASSSSENDNKGEADAKTDTTVNNIDTRCTQPNNNARSSSDAIAPSAFKALSLSSTDDIDASTKSPLAPPSAQPSPSDIIIAIRSARVDPVALIKSLTSTGSNIARRTANFISRTPDMSSGSTASESVSTDESGKGTPTAVAAVGGKEGGIDEVSVFSRPGLCYEDTDSDDEYSMYDYSDDFSTPNDDDDVQSEEEQIGNNSSDGDPSSIEFELSITFQGRKYNATRAFPTFVKLRDDLLREFNDGDNSETKHGLHYRRSRRNNGGAKSPISMDKDCLNKIPSANGTPPNKEGISIPELPRVSPESLGHGGYALTGVARSGFALLQATAQHYCPEMEHWMRQVIDAFPCSQSLSSFLWEPLSSGNENWETIGEGMELNGSDEACSNETSVFSKPPQYNKRGRSRPSNLSKSRFKSMGSMGSLNSIDEGDGVDVDSDDHST